MEKNDYEIQININSEENLYNPFDKFGKTLSNDVYSYINNRVEFANITDKIKIKVVSKNKIDNNIFIEAYNRYLDEQLKLVKRERKINTTRQLWLLFIGISFIIVSILLNEKVNEILVQIISIIGTFSIWESANSWLIKRKSIIGKIFKLKRLKNAEIRFK